MIKCWISELELKECVTAYQVDDDYNHIILTDSELEQFAKECFEAGQKSIGYRGDGMSRIDLLFPDFWKTFKETK